MRDHAAKRPDASEAPIAFRRRSVGDVQVTLTAELVAAALECPWCHRPSNGAVLEHCWQHRRFWQVRVCSECGRFLVATTEVDDEKAVHTHCATLRLCLSEPPLTSGDSIPKWVSRGSDNETK